MGIKNIQSADSSDIAFIAIGVEQGYAYWNKKDREVSPAGYGQDGVVYEAIKYAKYITAAWKPYKKGLETWNGGVWQYDVPERFGWWFAKQCAELRSFPAHSQCLARISQLVREAQGG